MSQKLTDTEKSCILNQLVTEYLWINDEGGLEWVWKEGVGLNRNDPELNSILIDLKREVEKQVREEGIQCPPTSKS